MDIQTADELLSTTRAVRRKLDLQRPVEREVLLDCLRVAIQAPTGSNQQGWRWIIVQDPATRAEIGKLYREVGEAYLAAKPAEQLEASGGVFSSAKHLVDNIERVPAFVIPCIEGRPGESTGGTAAMYGSIYPAVWSFQLALRPRGLGTCLTTFTLFREAEMHRLLGIPDDVSHVGLLPVAYTTQQDFRPAKRRPVEELTFQDAWGAPV